MPGMFEQEWLILRPHTQPCEVVLEAFRKHYALDQDAVRFAQVTAFHEACHVALNVDLNSELLYAHVAADGNIAGATERAKEDPDNATLAITALGGVFAALLSEDLDTRQLATTCDIHNVALALVKEFGTMKPVLTPIGRKRL
jgi:hypothetical protein